MAITYEIYDMAGAPVKDSNTLDDRVLAAEIYLTSPDCATISPTTSWVEIVAANSEAEAYSVLIRNATSNHEISARRIADGPPVSQGVAIGPDEYRRLIVQPGWRVYVRAAA
jgi:hypothetical protein